MPASVTLKAHNRLEGRICTQCQIYKDSSNFYLDKKNNNLYSKCNDCKKQYRIDNKEKIKNWHQDNYKKNKDKIYKVQLKWREENPEKWKELNKRARNSLKSKESKKKYRNKYYHDNKNDPLFFLSIVVRNRLRAALKAKSWRKTTKFNEYIGCSLEELKQHLEKQFTLGMTWDNYGHGKDKWTIDHIIPISSSTTPEEMYKLSHYLNLKPMWYLDNIKKSDICQLV